ncbi:MAG: 30S ribosomal protein S12 methylthiotransferase RimO [Clostridia bacterium]|nr:30S ribosomal protein S12 methylthiotransferase RimO [Clostridia bacterium]
MNKIGVISLGCDKNRIDTENMLAFLENEGFVFTGDPQDSDIIIVNTCAFIDSAKQESIDTILEMSDYKTNGKCKCLIVSGCLSQRYMDSLVEELPEVDIFVGTANYRELPQIIKDFAKNHSKIAIKNDINKRDFVSNRVLTTPYHYAYLKIAEGCNNNCTYCAIPKIRGKFTSRKMEDIVDEARDITTKYGVKELNIVAQDITRYGKDIYGEPKLVELLAELEKVDCNWIRLLYCYPELVTDSLIHKIAESSKIVKYIDIPMQHASDKILKRMNRHVRREFLQNLIDKLRAVIPNIAIRTTFIVGFPDENEEDFNILYEFVKKNKFDKCGFFAFSREDGTPAYDFAGQVEEDVKQERVAMLYELQEQIMAEKAEKLIGSEVVVMYEAVDFDNGCFIGRMAEDAPEIDRVVYFTAKKPVDIGELYKVKITDKCGLDLKGDLV